MINLRRSVTYAVAVGPDARRVFLFLVFHNITLLRPPGRRQRRFASRIPFETCLKITCIFYMSLFSIYCYIYFNTAQGALRSSPFPVGPGTSFLGWYSCPYS